MIVTVNGAAIRVLGPGTRETGGDPCLFFLHGASENAEVWEKQAEFFETSHAVYRMDLPGHGGSLSGGENRISAYADRVRRVLEKLLGPKPYVLVGHSMGGAIALELGLAPPSGLKGIVTVGSGARLAVSRAIFQMLTENPVAFFESIDRFAFSPAAPRALRERFIRMARQCPVPVIVNDFKACDSFDVRNRLCDIKLPALVLCGKDDQLTPLKYSTFLHKSIAGSSLVTLPDAGHMAMIEQPDQTNRAIESFLRNPGLQA